MAKFKNILRLRKGEELIFWILHKIMEIISFSIPRLVFLSATSPFVLCMYIKLYLFISMFLSCWPGLWLINNVYLCFRLVCDRLVTVF